MFRRSFALAAAFCTACASALGALVLLVACAVPPAVPPHAEFMVATPDSTYWVTTEADGLHVRGVPMTLTRYGGRFHEVYVADIDRAFDDAVFTGERLYVRDLVTGDSALVYDDTAVVVLARRYARQHPEARQLPATDDGPDDPELEVDGATDVLDVRGPFVFLEHRSTIDQPGGTQSDTQRVALDLRSGRRMSKDVATLGADSSEREIAIPATWRRAGYELLARGDTADGSVSFVIRDAALRSWPILTTTNRVRVYWLDMPPIDTATRHALARAFNSAASYDETVKYARFAAPHSARTSATPVLARTSTSRHAILVLQHRL